MDKENKKREEEVFLKCLAKLGFEGFFSKFEEEARELQEVVFDAGSKIPDFNKGQLLMEEMSDVLMQVRKVMWFHNIEESEIEHLYREKLNKFYNKYVEGKNEK